MMVDYSEWFHSLRVPTEAEYWMGGGFLAVLAVTLIWGVIVEARHPGRDHVAPIMIRLGVVALPCMLILMISDAVLPDHTDVPSFTEQTQSVFRLTSLSCPAVRGMTGRSMPVSGSHQCLYRTVDGESGLGTLVVDGTKVGLFDASGQPVDAG